MVGLRQPAARTLSTGAELLGGGLLAAALLWWGLVYYQVFLNTGFPLASAAPCFLHTSDTCSLAMSLCGGKHFLGVQRYSENLFWAGIVVTGVAIALRRITRRA